MLALAVKGVLGFTLYGQKTEPRHMLRTARTCVQDWDEVHARNKPKLTNTQSVTRTSRSKNFRDFDHGSGYQGLFVYPPANFAFCTIEKNACSAWTTVLSKLYRNDTGQRLPWPGVAQHAFDHFGPKSVRKVFRDRAAVKAVVVREPLSRFASAYLSKCVISQEANGHSCNTNPYCLARSEEDYGQPISFEKVVDWMLTVDPTDIDGHWSLQSEHCELRTRVREFSVIALYSKDSLARDSACIMKLAGISRFNTQGNGTDKPFWEDPSGGASERATSNPDILDEEQVLKRLFTPGAARRLIQHFHQDYKVFGFQEEPEWVQHATGEWYRSLPDGCSQDIPDAFEHSEASDMYGASAAPSWAGLLLEDDISALAAASGYPFDS